MIRTELEKEYQIKYAQAKQSFDKELSDMKEIFRSTITEHNAAIEEAKSHLKSFQDEAAAALRDAKEAREIAGKAQKEVEELRNKLTEAEARRAAEVTELQDRVREVEARRAVEVTELQNRVREVEEERERNRMAFEREQNRVIALKEEVRQVREASEREKLALAAKEEVKEDPRAKRPPFVGEIGADEHADDEDMEAFNTEFRAREGDIANSSGPMNRKDSKGKQQADLLEISSDHNMNNSQREDRSMAAEAGPSSRKQQPIVLHDSSSDSDSAEGESTSKRADPVEADIGRKQARILESRSSDMDVDNRETNQREVPRPQKFRAPRGGGGHAIDIQMRTSNIERSNAFGQTTRRRSLPQNMRNRGANARRGKSITDETLFREDEDGDGDSDDAEVTLAVQKRPPRRLNIYRQSRLRGSDSEKTTRLVSLDSTFLYSGV